MNTQTSLVAEQIRLQQWAYQIRDCQNRPSDMKVDVWYAKPVLSFVRHPLPSWNLQHRRTTYRKKRIKCISLWLQYFMQEELR